MKRLIQLLFFGVLSLILVGLQSASVKAQTVPLAITEGSYSLNTNSYAVTNTTARTFVWTINSHYKTTQFVKVKLHKVSGTQTNIAVTLKGYYSTGDTPNAIGSTVNWKLSTSDTTITFLNATANRYRIFEVGFVGTGTGVSNVTYDEFKVWWE